MKRYVSTAFFVLIPLVVAIFQVGCHGDRPVDSLGHHWTHTWPIGDGWDEFNTDGIQTGAIDPRINSCDALDFESSRFKQFETCQQAKRWMEQIRKEKGLKQ